MMIRKQNPNQARIARHGTQAILLLVLFVILSGGAGNRAANGQQPAAPHAPALEAAAAPPAPAPAPTSAEAAPPGPAKVNRIKAKLFYRDVEPKLLFQMLSDTYKIQFDEGAGTIVAPITLISKGDEPVDLEGMLPLLNDMLSRENKTAVMDGQVVRIVPLVDTQTRRIPLQYADPDKVVTVLRDLFLARSTDKPDQAARKVDFIGIHPQLREILVRGPKEVIAEVEKFVKNNIDLAPPAPPAPPEPQPIRKYVTLQYMDAEEFLKLMQQDENLKEKIKAAKAPNNTLILSSLDESVFAKVDEMRKAFDVDRMEIRYLPLSNTKAEDIAKLITQIYPAEAPALPEEMLKARRELVRKEAAPDGLAEAMEQAGVTEPELQELLSRSISIVAVGELTIIPDVARNSLIIRTFSRNFPKLLELIDKLDRPVDQVLIDVFITEVTLDDTLELGIDFTYNDTTNLFHNGKTTLRQNVGTATSTTGISYQIISDNITAFIRALQQTNRLDIITRPQIVTKDNAQANIELGRRVPLVTTTKVTPEGASTSDVKYEDVTTRLDVTPQIHPDAYITLNIKQTINDVSTETFQISEDFNPQVLIKRGAETQLRVKDGQTVCLGGFIGDNLKEEDTKVPLLGDIPVLGYLFKYKSKSHVKT